jgi:CRP/FNR family cyclic AMP-dependent transcriptional regulator
VFLHKDSKIELLKSVPLFAGCTKKELAAIARLTTLVDVPAGKQLVGEGERGHEFAVLVEGSADVLQHDQQINALSAGDFFGEIALVSDVPRTATVKTTSPAVLLVLTTQAFWSLVEQMPTIERRVLKTLAERLAPETV